MKGIRKLFLGLVFLALVGVGFAVNAKAAATPPSVSLKTDDEGKAIWSKNATRLVAKFKTGSDPFPAKFTDTNIDAIEWMYTFELLCDSAVLLNEDQFDKFHATRYLDESTAYEQGSTSTTPPYECEIIDPDTYDEITKAVIKANFGGNSASKNYTLKVYKTEIVYKAGGSSETSDPTLIGNETVQINGYKIEPKATFGPSKTTKDAPSVTISPNSVFLLEGEQDTFTISGTVGKGYVWDSWYFGDTSVSGTSTSCTFTASGDPSNNLVANYNKNELAGLTFTDKPLDGAVLASSGTIKRQFKFSGGYKGTNIDKAKAYICTNPGEDPEVHKPVTISYAAPGETGEIRFKLPDISSTDLVDLYIVMDDGWAFPFKLYVIDPTKVDFTLSGNTTETIDVGEKITYVPKLTPEIDNAEFSYPLAEKDKDCVSMTKDAGGKLYVTGVKVTTTGASFTPTVKYTVEGAEEIEARIATRTVKVNSPTLVFTSDIMVNEGLSAPLSRFVKNENTYVTKAEAKSSSYITVSPATGVARSIEIKGKSATKKVSGEFTADGQTAAVTVYPKPTLSLDKSGSGSSLKYTFKVTMPWNVYHGSTVIKDLSKAKIQFKGEKDTYTLDSFSLEKDTEDYTKKNKDTVSVEIKKMGEILNKICKNDKEEIEITAYADGDKDVISDKQTLKVYKIKVDGSSGADYKVNGETVSDYFYAIDGVSYEVSTTPKSGYSGTPEKWDGTSFGTNSNGTVSFSESKTIKAYYKGGTSSPSTSGRNSGAAGDGTGEGYDDVPKTGESKTDIWILWSVLFISILGAGFMIWKRFGLARAIAEADQQVAIAEHEEMVKAEEKEKKDKLDMLKGLRNL